MSVPSNSVPGMDHPERFTHQTDQYEAWQRETIRRHGWALQAVLGDEESPPFVYTVGLAGFRHAELILFATTQATAAVVLNEVGRARAGRAAARAGERVPLSCGAVYLLSFPESEHWLFAANDLYRSVGGPPVPALLVVPMASSTRRRAKTSRVRFARDRLRGAASGRHPSTAAAAARAFRHFPRRGGYQAWERSACWRIHACIAIPAATPALIERVEPNCAIDTVSRPPRGPRRSRPAPPAPKSSTHRGAA